MLRNISHRLIQSICWNPLGRLLLHAWLWLKRRVDYVAFNYSLHTPTNGELWLLSQLPEAPVVIDVGYNTGDFTTAVLAARAGAQVTAFDPARFALRNFEQAHAADARVKFENIALSNLNGEAEFHDYGNMSSSLAARQDQGELNASTYRVPVLRLADYAREHGLSHFDFLKIDAEGFDLHVLEGAGELLDSQAIDFFMFEYADGWISSRRFLSEASEYLGGKPYCLFRLYNGFLAPFKYEPRHERFDLGCMYVCASRDWLSTRTKIIRPAAY